MVKSEKILDIPMEKILGISLSEPNTESHLDHTVTLFERAKTGGSIKIASLEPEEGFYNNPKIIKALEKATDRKVSIDIILGSTMEIGNNNLKTLWEEGKVNFWLFPKPHYKPFIVVDDKHVTLNEKLHLTGESKLYWYDTIALGAKRAREFTALQMKAKRLLPDIQKDIPSHAGVDAGGAGSY